MTVAGAGDKPRAIHAMLRVLDEARAIRFYEQALGLTVAERLAFDGFTLIYMAEASTGFEVELTVNHGRTEPYALGDGYGHVAFSVSDLDAIHARLSADGFAPTPIKELSLGGRSVARFCFLTDPDGYRIEILQRGGRFL